jgi:hypothetical protein
MNDRMYDIDFQETAMKMCNKNPKIHNMVVKNVSNMDLSVYGNNIIETCNLLFKSKASLFVINILNQRNDKMTRQFIELIFYTISSGKLIDFANFKNSLNLIDLDLFYLQSSTGSGIIKINNDLSSNDMFYIKPLAPYILDIYKSIIYSNDGIHSIFSDYVYQFINPSVKGTTFEDICVYHFYNSHKYNKPIILHKVDGSEELKIYKILDIYTFAKLKQSDYYAIRSLRVGESIFIKPSFYQEVNFDCYVIKKREENIYDAYLFSITIDKEHDRIKNYEKIVLKMVVSCKPHNINLNNIYIYYLISNIF